MTREQTQYSVWKDRLKQHPVYTAELEAIADSDEEITDRFYRDLSFGTAGLRGVLGLGSNRMNVFTVRRATQGLAEYLLSARESPSAAIAYDSRVNSDLFARETACVLAANGIKARLYQELMPTPALSYAVRELGCDAGVVITASHNPAKYNGYKVYGADGCQIGPEAADKVLRAITCLDIFDGAKHIPFEEGVSNGMIEYIPDSFVNQYIDRVLAEAIQPQVCVQAGLGLVYTPLNGAGNRCVRETLQRAGITDLTVVPQQEAPDGGFPTCPYPNPEMKEALELGLALCRQIGADLLVATDPDADRMAAAVNTPDGCRILTGNEIGVLLLDYIAASRKRLGTLPRNPVAVKSLVSSPLADEVAKEHGVEMRSVLTGFKFIGEVIAGLEREGEGDRFIFGFEESCGYLTGSYVRDKDAVDAVLLLVEMASHYKLAGKTLADALEDIYHRHGIFRSVVANFAFEGANGMKTMARIMGDLRDAPPVGFAGDKVVRRLDYKHSACVEDGQPIPVELPPSDVLEYALAGGSSIIIRPSGTEPKIKVYYSLRGETEAQVDDLAKKYAAACEERIRGASGGL